MIFFLSIEFAEMDNLAFPFGKLRERIFISFIELALTVH